MSEEELGNNDEEKKESKKKNKKRKEKLNINSKKLNNNNEPNKHKKYKTSLIENETEKQQILKQIELSDKIKEIEHRIQLELEQYNIVINKKKEELSHIEKRVKQINDKNESLNMAYEKIKKEMEDKYNNKNKLKENKNLNNDKNDIIKEEDPLVIKIKENENIIEDTRKTMENYQKEINKLENIIFDDENLNQINKIKFEIKNVKERLNTLEKEKKYLLIVSEEHNKCIESVLELKNYLLKKNRSLMILCVVTPIFNGMKKSVIEKIKII